MKAYTFVNTYVCGIQVGIQAGHSLVRHMADHGSNPIVAEWVSEHQTFVWLDGGDSRAMDLLAVRLEDAGIPFTAFREEGMDDLLTSITFVLDERDVSGIDQLRLDIMVDRSILREDPRHIFDVIARAKVKTL